MNSTGPTARRMDGRRDCPFGSGFTLLELLVVIGMIGFLGAAVGLALSGRAHEGPALAAAQQIVASLVGATRMQALLHQTHARLIVAAHPIPGSGGLAGGLRRFQIVREEPFASGAYVAVGHPVVLPEPICIVPSVPRPSGSVAADADSPVAGSGSTLSVLDSFQYSGQPGDRPPSGRSLSLEFGPDGLVTDPAPSASIVLTATISGDALSSELQLAGGVRAVLVRQSGAISLLDDPADFR